MDYRKSGVLMNNTELAEAFGVSEGTIRYWKKREGLPDRRHERPSGIEAWHSQIEEWLKAQEGRRKAAPLRLLFEHLDKLAGFAHGYDSVRRYVKKHWPDYRPGKLHQRIETPPGALTQIDWKEDVKVRLGSWDNQVPVQFFLALLAFSRHGAAVVSMSKDMDSFLHCHNVAWKKLGGLTEWVRTDCLATAVSVWHGQSSTLAKDYRRYLDNLGIKAFPARPGTPQDKGKVEKRIQDLMGRLDLEGRVFKDLEELQAAVDAAMDELESTGRSGATGLGIRESWGLERKALKALPEILPTDVVRQNWAVVRKDGTVTFAHNFYQVPHSLVGQRLLCVQTASKVQILHHGELVGSWPILDRARGMIRLSDQVLKDPQNPLSPLTKAWAQEVALRQIEYYQAILGEGAS